MNRGRNTQYSDWKKKKLVVGKGFVHARRNDRWAFRHHHTGSFFVSGKEEGGVVDWEGEPWKSWGVGYLVIIPGSESFLCAIITFTLIFIKL